MADHRNTSGAGEETHEQDAVTQTIEGIFSQWRMIGVIAVGLLVIAAIYGYASSQQKKAENAAWTAIAKSERDAKDNKGFAESLTKVIQKHNGTEAVSFAQVQLMRAQFDNDDIDAATKTAEEFLRQHPRHFLAPQVRADYGRLLEWQAKWGPAREEYTAVLNANRRYLVPEAQLGVARCLEQENRTSDAREEYLKTRSQAENERWAFRIRQATDLRLMALAPEADIPAAPTATDEAMPEPKAEESATETTTDGGTPATETTK